MNARRILLATVLVSVLAVNAPAQQPSAQSLPKLVDTISKAMARLEFTLHDELLGSRQQVGQAVCIDAARGTFLTLDVPTNVRREDFKDFMLIPAGTPGNGIKAELLGSDPQAGITFLRATEQRSWEAVRFSRSANLQIGQRVMSVGLLGPSAGNVPYLGSAVVGAKLRLPHRLIYVTGGELTIMSSPVITSDGRAVGIVGGEVPMEARMQLGNRWVDVFTMGRQRTRFFLPVDEFADLLAEIPTPSNPKRLAWTGVLRFQPVSLKEEELDKGLKGRAAVIADQIVPDSPAAKAGLAEADTIVALNGQPLEKLPTPGLTRDSFWRALQQVKPGQTVSLTIRRKGTERTCQIVTEAMPKQPYEAPRYYSAVLGLAARDLVMLDRYGQPGQPMLDKGVRVFAVIAKSAADKGDLARGDVVTGVNGKPVESVEALKVVLDPIAKPGSITPITFMVIRDGQDKAVTVTPPPQPR